MGPLSRRERPRPAAGTVPAMRSPSPSPRPGSPLDIALPLGIVTAVALAAILIAQQFSGHLHGTQFYEQYLHASGHAPPQYLEEKATVAAKRSGPGLTAKIGDNTAKGCSSGFPIVVNGTPVTVTAGHCVEDIDDPHPEPIPNFFGLNGYATATHSLTLSEDGGPNRHDGGLYGADIGITTLPSGLPPFPARETGSPEVGDSVCLFGRTSGWSCGEVEGLDLGGRPSPARLWRTTLLAAQGDSGAVVYRDGVAVGILSYITGPNGSDEVTGSLITDLGDTLDVITSNGHQVEPAGT